MNAVRPAAQPAVLPLSPYAGCEAVIATMHGKESAVLPAFAGRLGMSLQVPPGIDTDALGTFTGEIARTGTVGETAVAKARLGMRATGLALGIASEGSYGPHPSFPFVPAGIELMVFVDDLRGIVVQEQLIDEAPVYERVVTRTLSGIGDFLERIGFPAQAVIVRPNTPGQAAFAMRKGLRLLQALEEAVAVVGACSRDGCVVIETDMRAHMNPSRMKTLGRLAERLAARIATPCPACRAPGFGRTGSRPGLPCAWCGGPSLLVRSEVFGCPACDFREERPRNDGLDTADPGDCPRCNP